MIDIYKFNQQLLNNNNQIKYVGRGKSLAELGLGNPFSHKETKVAVWLVDSLEDCISEYRKWLYKLLKAALAKDTERLELWEKQYLKKVVALAKEIRKGDVEGLMCWCINFPNYQADSKVAPKCHAQILYKGIVWLLNQLEQRRSQSRQRLVTPEFVTKLKPNEIFVYGTNVEGRHGKGAAKCAFGNYQHSPGSIGKWAVYGTAKGYMQGYEGASYGIVTKELRSHKPAITIEQVRCQVKQFLAWAGDNPDKKCLVTMIGCSLAGFKVSEIVSLFSNVDIPANVALPQEFWDVLDKH
ncbi:MAG: DUF4326 domain-containing protein [Crinalium sp.]